MANEHELSGYRMFDGPQRSAEPAYYALLAELRSRLEKPERDLLGTLGTAVADLVIEAQQRAIEHQGRVIMAAISGELTAWPGCMPDWDDRPLAAEVPA